jgi:two-component system phosphate regulon sensor histidine kinase PhoR
VNEPQWYERLHWRAFSLFSLFLAGVNIPTWYLVLGRTTAASTDAVERALAASALASVAAAFALMFVGRSYVRRRLDTVRQEMIDSVLGTERLRSGPVDDFTDLSADLTAAIARLRGRLGRLEQEKGRLSTLLEGMSEAVIMTDERERLLVANPEAERLLELANPWEGRRLAEVTTKQKLTDLVSDVLWNGKGTLHEIDMPGADDDIRHISVSSAPISVEDQIVGAVVVLYDVTRLRRLERVRRDFVANVSHELKTPIASIASAAETLLLPGIELSDMGREFAETIQRNASRMAGIVEDLLTLSRLEAEGDERGLGLVELPAVFADVYDRSWRHAEEAELEFEVDLEEDIPQVEGEARSLGQVIHNLVENAMKYTAPGGKVSLRARQERNTAVIEVADTGVGIPKEHLPRIFERFYRVDEGRSREVGGTGLGLAIVKHNVRKLGGRIDVRSEPGNTVFTIRLNIPVDRSTVEVSDD